MRRRPVLIAGSAAWLPARAQTGAQQPVDLLRAGRLVVAMRHAHAPGNFDPPGFTLGDCATQRNLGEEGRSQARRTGAWFRERGLRPLRVMSSPWCRCMDTARLAFGSAEAWPALGSPHGTAQATNAASLAELRRALAGASRRPGFEVWVTHMFVIQALAGTSTASGEALLLRAGDDAPVVLARLDPA